MLFYNSFILLVVTVSSQILKIEENFMNQNTFLYQGPQTIDSGITIVEPSQKICSYSFFSTFSKNVLAFCSNSSYLETIDFYFLNGGYIEFTYAILKVSTSNIVDDVQILLFYMADDEKKYTRLYIERMVEKSSPFNKIRYDFRNREIKFKILPLFNTKDAVLILNNIRIYKNNDEWLFNSYGLFFTEKYVSEKTLASEIDVSNSTDSICRAYETNSSRTSICPNLKDYNRSGFNTFCFRYPSILLNSYRYVTSIPPYSLIVFNLTFCDLPTKNLPDLDVASAYLLKSNGYILPKNIARNFTPAYSFAKTPYWKTIHLYIDSSYWTTLLIDIKAAEKYHKNLLINDFKVYYDKNRSIPHNNSDCYSKNISQSGSSSYVPECTPLMNSKNPCVAGLDYILSGYNAVKNEFGPVIFSPIWTNSYISNGYTIPSNINITVINETTQNNITYFDSFDNIQNDYARAMGINFKYSADPNIPKRFLTSKTVRTKEGAFSLDIDFQKQYQKYRSNMNTVIKNHLKEEFRLNIVPLLDLNFQKDLLSLPKKMDEFQYMKFILKYGTHYINNVVTGGFIRISSSVHQCEIQSYSKRSLYLDTFTQIAGAFINVGFDASLQKKRLEYYENKNLRIEVDGGFSQLLCCDNCDLDKWAETVKFNPTVVSMDLYEISTLADDEAVKDNLEDIVEKYMKQSLKMINKSKKKLKCGEEE